MDKSDSGKTITIKINGKDRPFKEDKKVERKDLKKGSSHQKNDSAHLSKQMDPVVQETAAARELDEELFDWILPELPNDEDELKEYTKVSNPDKSKEKSNVMEKTHFFAGAVKNQVNAVKKKTRKGFLPSIFFAVFFAVLLGISFGFIMLKLVITEHPVETTANPAIVPEQKVTNEEKPSAGVVAQLTPITTYIVQGGVYSNKESANTIQTEIAKKGAPTALVESNGKAYIYIGLGDTIDKAKAISKSLKNSGVDAFAKEVTVGGNKVSELSKEDKKVLDLAPAVFELTAKNSSNATISNTIPGKNLEELNNQVKSWSQINKEDLKNKNIKEMKGELDSAITLIQQYAKQPQTSIETELQQHLLKFLQLYGLIR